MARALGLLAVIADGGDGERSLYLGRPGTDSGSDCNYSKNHI